jgi:hypothetical protein
MQTRRSLRNVITRTGGSAASARRAPSPGAARGQLARKIAVPALVLVSFGATAAASPGTGQAARAQHPAITTVNAAGCAARTTAPAHAATRNRPWMYAITNGRPWMYAITAGRPWMYAMINARGTGSRRCPQTASRVTA